MMALEVRDLYKSFGKKSVLRGLDFSVSKGSVTGFLGKNGSGKTTTMQMILGFLRPDRGVIRVFGETVRYGETRTNRRIGYLPDVPSFYGYLTPLEYLDLCADISAIDSKRKQERIVDLLDFVGLRHSSNQTIAGFSRGMKQRLGVAQALLGEPDILICDEPTSALDPIGRREILGILKEARRDMTVLFSTHILSDVESVCDQVIVLDGGKNVLEGDIQALKGLHTTRDIRLVMETAEDLKRLLQTEAVKAMDKTTDEKTLRLKAAYDENGKREVLRALLDAQVFPIAMQITEESLEDLFIEAIEPKEGRL